MESRSTEKRSTSIKYIALGSLVAFSTTLTGCSKAPSIAQNNQDQQREKEENSTTGSSNYGGHGGGGSIHAPLTGKGTVKPSSGTISRGWFGGFRFSGG